MFLTGIKTEPIPERILSICQAVEDRGPISRKDLEKLLVPEKLNTAKTSYFGPVFDAATELKLIGPMNMIRSYLLEITTTLRIC